MKKEIFGGKPSLEKDYERICTSYNSYASNKVDSHSNMFYAFTLDKMVEIQDFLYASGYKDLLHNEHGLYMKKTDIFRAVCTDKIYQALREHVDLFILNEQYVFLGKDNYHKPDLTLFLSFTEETFDDYLDNHLTNPVPDVIIEVIDATDVDYLVNLVRVYRRIKVVGEILVFFIDPIKRELYVMRNDVQITGNDKEILMYLGKIDYWKDIHYKTLNLNFEKILSRQ